MSHTHVAMVTLFPEDSSRIVGGVAGVARYLAPALASRAECRVSVIAPGAAEDRKTEIEGVSVRYLRAAPRPGFATYWTIERMKIAAALRELRPDVVHFQGIAGWGPGLGLPSVLTLHGVAERDILYTAAPFRRARSRVVGAVEGIARRRYQHVISISRYLDDLLASQLRGRVWHIENPVGEAFFGVRRADDGRSILLLASVIERKNILGAIDSFARLVRKGVDARLRIGGSLLSSRYVERCRRLAADSGVSGRVDWLGGLSATQVREELATAACLFLPSFQETAPLVIQEAMAAAVPVVASRLCGIPYLVDEGTTGFLIDPANPQTTAEAIIKLLASRSLRESFGADAQRAASERFRAQAVAQRTLDVYEAALERRAPV